MQYERGIVKCVSSILEGKPERTEKVCAASTEPWWGLPDAQLGEFLGSQQVRLQEAALHKHAIWNTLPMRAKQEADKLEQDVQDAIQQRLVRLSAPCLYCMSQISSQSARLMHTQHCLSITAVSSAE